MARGYTTRKLEVWSLHARLNGQPADYSAMFQALAGLDPGDRQWDDGEKVVAIREMTVAGGKVYLTALEGPHGQPIIFDTEDSTEQTGALRPSQIVATRTHALIDLASREAIIEYNHRGAKAHDIAATLGVSGRRVSGWKTLYVELSPKIDHTFVESIDEFERIRLAGVRLGRPNYDWTDWDDEIGAAASDSDAQTAEVEFAAQRGESLAKDKGIIPFIKSRAKDGISAMKNAYVVGRRPDDATETKVTLGDHKEHHRINVKMDADQNVDEADIRRHLEQYDSSRPRSPDGN
jgi:hypothetical protein